jgi:hypothetical protein
MAERRAHRTTWLAAEQHNANRRVIGGKQRGEIPFVYNVRLRKEFEYFIHLARRMPLMPGGNIIARTLPNPVNLPGRRRS